MPTDLEREVSEMPCPGCHGRKRTKLLYVEGPCEPCSGTGLRWSPLSRECGCDTGEVRLTYTDTGNYAKTIKCPDCHGSGRVSDVTLDKVVDLLIPYSEYGDRVEIVLTEAGYLVFPLAGTGNTKADAACAALLASVKA